MERIDITPVAKGRPKVTKNGRVYTPKKTREYEAQIFARLFDKYRNTEHWNSSGPCQLTVEFHLPRPQRLMRKKDDEGPILHTVKPDASNLLKAFEDGAEGALWENDSQIFSVAVTKYYHAKDEVPHIKFAVWRQSTGWEQETEEGLYEI